MAATSSPQATRQIDLFAELHEAPLVGPHRVVQGKP